MPLRLIGAVAAACALALAAPAANAGSSRVARATADRNCLTSDTRDVLESAEAHFGVTFKIVSTCRPGAFIAGTRHASQHRYGRAVDLIVPHGTSKADVVRWLYAHASGVTMIYRGLSHIHFDTGPFHKLACGGCKPAKRAYHVRAAQVAP